MKSTTLTILIILLTFYSFGQVNFAGDNPQLYIGKQLKVKEQSESLKKYGFTTFYNGTGSDKKLFLAINQYSTKTFYDSLVGKVFICDSVIETKDEYYKYYLVLRNDSLNYKCYYQYSHKSKYSFEFEVLGGLTIEPEKEKVYTENELIEKYCKKIHYDYDKFKKDTIFRSPYLENIQFLKYPNGIIYISLTCKGSTVNVNEVGVTILLENNIKIIRSKEKISVDASSDRFDYSAFFRLSSTDIEKLKQNKITDFQLYIYDKNISKEKGLMYQTYLKCILKK